MLNRSSRVIPVRGGGEKGEVREEGGGTKRERRREWLLKFGITKYTTITKLPNHYHYHV